RSPGQRELTAEEGAPVEHLGCHALRDLLARHGDRERLRGLPLQIRGRSRRLAMAPECFAVRSSCRCIGIAAIAAPRAGQVAAMNVSHGQCADRWTTHAMPLAMNSVTLVRCR